MRCSVVGPKGQCKRAAEPGMTRCESCGAAWREGALEVVEQAKTAMRDAYGDLDRLRFELQDESGVVIRAEELRR